jgi:hypothetical protein
MASVAAPYGFRVVGGMDSNNANLPQFEVAYPAGEIAAALAKGSIINIGASAVTAITATPTTTRNGNSPWGIITGFKAKGPAESNLGFFDYLPASAITAGYSNIVIQYTTAVRAIMQIQAGANTNASTAIGKNAAITYTAPDSLRKVSKITLDAATIATTNTLGLKIIGFAPGSAATDTYPDYWVTWNTNVHAWDNTLGV